MQTVITITQHEKTEWQRMADAAWSAGYLGVSLRYRLAASVPVGSTMEIARFDALQAAYRSWLTFNDFAAADYMVNPTAHRQQHTGNFNR
jgi:hypothetical protein